MARKRHRKKSARRTPPGTKERYTFRIGDVFAPDDEVGLFLVSLTAALNDLLYANRLLVPERGRRRLLRHDPTSEENLYLIRLVAGHVWETLLLVRDASELRSIKAFLDGLIPEGRARYAEVLAAATDRTNETYKTLAIVRNHSWHYPRPDNFELRSAVTAVADETSALEMGERMPSIRGLFADEVFTQILTRFSGDDEAALGRIFQQLSAIVVAIVHLAQWALDDYLGRLHADSVRHEPGA